MSIPTFKLAVPYAVFFVAWLLIGGIIDHFVPQSSRSVGGFNPNANGILWHLIFFRTVAINFFAIPVAAIIASRFGAMSIKLLVVVVVLVWGTFFVLNMALLQRLNPDPEYSFFSWSGIWSYEFWPVVAAQFVGILCSAIVAGLIVKHITNHSTRTPTS